MFLPTNEPFYILPGEYSDSPWKNALFFIIWPPLAAIIAGVIMAAF